MSSEIRTDRPSIQIYEDSQRASRAAAEMIAATIRSKPKCVLGLATGGTPVETYRQLIRMHSKDGLDFSAVTTFNLDEYIGLPPGHPQSYRHFMQQHLFDHINVPHEQTHVPNGMAPDFTAEAAEYESRIARCGGIDLQLLGLGHNGHIAFNEPGSPRDSRTRVVELTQQTIEKNSRFFDSMDQVPRQALTMGIGTILESKRIVMLAFGQAKAEAVRWMVEGESDERHPASLLQQHGDVTLLLDKAAASAFS